METQAIIWDEAKRLLVRQEANLDGLRTRALALLSAGGLIAGLFAAASAGHKIVCWHAGFRVAAVALFGVSTVLALWIQWPRSWGFSRSLKDDLTAIAAGKPADTDEVYFNFAQDADDARACNEAKIKWLTRALTGICLTLGLQVVCWVLAVY